MKKMFLAGALVAFITVGAFAQYAPESDFEVQQKGRASMVITKYKGKEASVNIPPRIQNLSVSAIGPGAFMSNMAITSVTIPSGVADIEDCAFYDCKNLSSVTIPNTIGSIGEAAFQGCSLESVTIPLSVSSIGPSVFNSCAKLTSVTLSNRIKLIPLLAFANCTKLASITIPLSVTAIEEEAFNGCDSLASITIPAMVKAIGGNAFTKVTSVTFAGTIPASEFDKVAFPGDLRNKYLAGGKGTYTRPNATSTTWTKN